MVSISWHWIVHALTCVALLACFGVLGKQYSQLEEAAARAAAARVEAEATATAMRTAALERQRTLTASVARAEAELAVLRASIVRESSAVRRAYKAPAQPVSGADAAGALTHVVTSTAVVALTGESKFAARARLVEGRALVTLTSTEAGLVIDIVGRLPAAVRALDAAERALTVERGLVASTRAALDSAETDNETMTARLSQIAGDAAGQPIQDPSFLSTTITVGGIAVGVGIVAIAGAIAFGASR